MVEEGWGGRLVEAWEEWLDLPQRVGARLAPLIGAIVAEFFGSPTRGMGFRISTAVGSLALPMVWAQIVVAALAGTAFFGLVTLIERRVTFWHPSQRGVR